MLFLFLLIVALLAAVGVLQAMNIKVLKENVASLNQEKDSYSPILKKIAKLKKARIELERKTGVINKLKADSSLTVRVIDEVASRVDENRVWLNALNQQGSTLRLTGIALDNQTVAQFMDKLKDSPFVRSVTLTSSSLKKVSGRDLKAFSLYCNVAQPVLKEPAKTAMK